MCPVILYHVAVEEEDHRRFSVHGDVEHQAHLFVSRGIPAEKDSQHRECQHQESRQEHVRIPLSDPEIDADADDETDDDADFAYFPVSITTFLLPTGISILFTSGMFDASVIFFSFLFSLHF